MYKVYLVLLLFFAYMNLHGQRLSPDDFYLSQWYQGRAGAISVTFDDACYTQYTEAYPILEKRNIKATFSVVGEWVKEEPSLSAEKGFFEIKRMGWPQFLDLFNHGNELAAHGYKHEKYDNKTAVLNLAREMRTIKNLIEGKTKKTVYTMHYPYSYTSGSIPYAARVAGYLFGRSGLDTINPPSPENMYLLATQAILSESVPDSATFKNWMSQANGNWLILMYHHFFRKDSKETGIIQSHDVLYSYNIYPELFDWQMEIVANTGYWVAPLCTIGKYIKERENTSLRVKIRKRRVKIYSSMNLNTTVFDQNLTLTAELPWKKVRIKGGLTNSLQENNEGKIYIDFKPGAKIIIKKAP